jgi:DNA polymerase III subunit alpha
MYLVFDTETTGLPRDWNAPLSDLSNWPRVVQLAWQLHGQDGELIEARDYLICPEGFNIPFGSQEIHGISTELARAQGHQLTVALDAFQAALSQTAFMVGHNLKFDLNVLGAEFLRIGLEPDWMQLPVIDTMTPQTAALVGIQASKTHGTPQHAVQCAVCRGSQCYR